MNPATKKRAKKKYDYKIKLHNKQLEIFKHPSRFKLIVCGRRFGKSKILRTKVIAKSLEFNDPIDPSFPPVVVLVMPTRVQAVQVHWDALVNELKGQPFVENINISDRRIIFKGDKPDILLRGANEDDGNGLRGLKIYYLAADEYQDFKEKIWDEVLRPALADTRGSTADFVGTPKGKNHRLYRFYQKILKSPYNKSWQYFHYVTGDNPFFSKKELNEARETTPPKAFRQEYEASFEDFDGQIFDQITDDTYVSYLPNINLSYYIGVDFGDVNPAIVVLALDSINRHYYIVDCWFNHGGQPITQEELFREIHRLSNKYDVYRCYMPDDRPATIIAARLYGKKNGCAGMQRTTEVKRNEVKVMERCDIVNSFFFQNKLSILAGLDSIKLQLENYHRATDKDGLIVNKVADGQVDHLVDALMYVIIKLHTELQKLK